MDYKIRTATREELDILVEWAAKEGWNPGLHDADIFWNTDPGGFYVGLLDNEPISCISAVKYGSELCFMGFYIVKPEYRSKGYGLKIWNEALKHSPVRSMGLDGVFAQQDNYKKSGFIFSHRNLRMESIAVKKDYDKNVLKIESKDFNKVNIFDKFHFGFDRKKFLEGWLNMPESTSYKYEDESGLKGYGTVRKCRKGYKIGPLFASNYDVAHELFKALASFAVGELLYLDTPEINKDAMKLASVYQMKECFGCARMYYGPAPKLPYDQIYGVTTFELG